MNSQNYFTATQEQYKNPNYTPSTSVGLTDSSLDVIPLVTGATSGAIALAKGVDGIVGKEIVQGINKADFYIKSSGDVIPTTGYRAVGNSGVEMAKEGNLMSKNGDTYFTFTNLEGKSANEIQSILQLPHTPTHYGTFDTLQIANDIKVPYGNWGTADYLEPIVKDFPQFGISGYPNGGATQAITKTPINDYILKEIR